MNFQYTFEVNPLWAVVPFLCLKYSISGSRTQELIYYWLSPINFGNARVQFVGICYRLCNDNVCG